MKASCNIGAGVSLMLFGLTKGATTLPAKTRAAVFMAAASPATANGRISAGSNDHARWSRSRNGACRIELADEKLDLVAYQCLEGITDVELEVAGVVPLDFASWRGTRVAACPGR